MRMPRPADRFWLDRTRAAAQRPELETTANLATARPLPHHGARG